MSERARALIDKNHIQKEAIAGQWWELSESGKRWELWFEDAKGMLHRLTYINRKNVLWVIPEKKQEVKEHEL